MPTDETERRKRMIGVLVCV